MDNKYKSIPFWSWNNKLDKKELISQIEQMKNSGMGGFFMHARGGLKTEYLSAEWFDCVKACLDKARELDMNAWVYDENGWPSGFAGGKLLQDEANLAHYITYKTSDTFDENALANYIIENDTLKYISTDCGKNTYHHVYDNISRSNTDVLDERVIKKFIEETHEKYYEHFSEYFGNTLKGFFIDEPQYYRADTPYSLTLPDIFLKKYGIILKEKLGLLFVDCKNSYSFRFKYWKTLQELFLKNFIKQIYDWCLSHNCMLTGHGCEETYLFTQMWCCAGVMPMYEYFSIPGVDWLGRDIKSELCPKQLGSVAAQLGKKQAITETFGCTGWDTTPRELKKIADYQYVNGVNLMCQHLYDYSIEGQGKRDYPLHFGEQNTWFDDSSEFNDYYSQIGYKLSSSKELVNVAVLHPISSCYLTYKRNSDAESVRLIEEPFTSLIEWLGKNNIYHHYIDETILEKYGRVENGKLIVGNCEYDVVILPYLLNLESSSLKILKEYAKHGKLIAESGLPQYLNGEPYSFSEISQNYTLKQLIDSTPIKIRSNDMVRSSLRSDELGDFLYIVNLSDNKATVNIEYLGKTFIITLNKVESRIIYLSDLKNDMKDLAETINLNNKFTLLSDANNYLTIDKLQVSFDGVKYSATKYFYQAYEDLIYNEFNGKLYLKYSFSILAKTKVYNLICEDMDIKNVFVNAHKVELLHENKLDRKFLSCSIKDFVRSGNNDIIFEIDFFSRKDIKKILYGENITESLINCLYYDSIIESIYIEGDFGVYSDNVAYKDNLIYADNFYLDKQKKVIEKNKIVESGFFFFAGTLNLQQNIDITNTNCKLIIDERFATCKVFINDKFVKNCIFETEVDIRKFVKIGTNSLRLQLTNSNRNLFGPHHFAYDGEPKALSPFHFSMSKTWTKGKSNAYRDNYSFVKIMCD